MKLDALDYDDRSQAVVLNKGMPIISKVNNEEIGIFNNQRFKIVKIGSLTITIEDDFKNLKKNQYSRLSKVLSCSLWMYRTFGTRHVHW